MRFASIVAVVMVLASSMVAAAPPNENRELRFVGLHHLPAEQAQERSNHQPHHHLRKHPATTFSFSSDDDLAGVGSGSDDHHPDHHDHHHHRGPHKRSHKSNDENDSGSKTYEFNDASSFSYSPGIVHPAEVGSDPTESHHHRHHHHHDVHKRSHDVDVGSSEANDTNETHGFDDVAGSSYTPGTVHPAEIGSDSDDTHHQHHSHHHQQQHHRGHHKRSHEADAGSSKANPTDKTYDFDDIAGSSYTPGSLHPAGQDTPEGVNSAASY